MDTATPTAFVEVVADRHVYTVRCRDCPDVWHTPVTLSTREIAEQIADLRRAKHACPRTPGCEHVHTTEEA